MLFQVDFALSRLSPSDFSQTTRFAMLPQLPLPVRPAPVWTPDSAPSPTHQALLSTHLEHSFPPSPTPRRPSTSSKHDPVASINPHPAQPELSNPSQPVFTGSAPRTDQPEHKDRDQPHSSDIEREGPEPVIPSRPIPSPKHPSQDEIMEGSQSEESEREVEIFGTPPTGVVGKTRPRAVVRIERDYSARGATSGRVQFWDGWVAELEGRVSYRFFTALQLLLF